MSILDLFGRKTMLSSQDAREGSDISRVEYLLRTRLQWPEGSDRFLDGVRHDELIERQLADGSLELATQNLGRKVERCFEAANLHWGQGNTDQAEFYLQQTLDAHRKIGSVWASRGSPMKSYYGVEYAKSAACLLNTQTKGFTKADAAGLGYEPWFINTLLDRCLDERDFDVAEWEASADAWARKRHPKYRLKEFGVYVKALTGAFNSADEMLDEHERMFKGRAKRPSDSDLLDGYNDNELIIDYIFASILKRIGWEGTYRHSWPNTAPDYVARTTKQPDRYLREIASPPPSPDPGTGMFADAQAARRFIDLHLPGQRDEEGNALDARRPAAERGKVASALKELGWTSNPVTLDLIQIYRVDRILNERTHLSLCDPVGGSSLRLDAWNKRLYADFDLHSDFIAIAGSEDRSDYYNPQGAWYVYWKKNRKIYAVDRPEWDRPDLATNDARPGINLWPSYASFVAWWISEHLKYRALQTDD